MIKPLTDLRDRPLFICGHPKAGTSLLRAIFDSHPQLVVYPEETVFFRRFLPRSEGLDLPAQLELAEQTLIHIFRWNAANPTPDQDDFPGRDYSSIPFDEVKKAFYAFVGEQIRHPGEFLGAAVMAFGQVSGQLGEKTRWWVEKSPYNEYYTRQIFTWWPEARCIHIVRDPRDNFASYRRKHPGWAPEFFARNWRRSTKAGLDNQRQYGDQRYLLVRYEDLTRSPSENIQKITRMLDIDWDPALVSPTRLGEQWQGNSMFANQFQEISAAPVTRWKEQLDQLDAAIIELGTAPLLSALGYRPEAAVSGSASRWVAARTRLLTWPVRRRMTQRTRKTSQETGS